MGVAEKVLLASLKAQRSQVAKQAERSGLDAQTRALMQENLAYLQAQIDVLEAGGTTADLEGVPQPASWDSDDQDAPAIVSASDAGATASIGGTDSGTEVSPGASTGSAPGWWGGMPAKVILTIAIIAAIVVCAIWVANDILNPSGCDIYTSGGGWEHYEAGDPACDDID